MVGTNDVVDGGGADKGEQNGRDCGVRLKLWATVCGRRLAAGDEEDAEERPEEKKKKKKKKKKQGGGGGW